MSFVLIKALEFIRKQAERNPERIFSAKEIASQLKVSPKTIRYYMNDFVDTLLVEIVPINGQEYLKALPRFLEVDCEWMKHKPGTTKYDNKVPYAERIPIEHIQQFYNALRKQSRTEEDEKFVNKLGRRLLSIGERTTVYSHGSGGKWLRCLNDLRQSASISEKIIAVDSLVSFIHGRGRIAPLIIKAKKSKIPRILNSIAKE